MKKYLVLLLLFLISGFSNAKEIRVLATINNQSITNYDLLIEIQTIEFLNDIKISNQQHSMILQQIVNNKIKEIEIQTYKLNINEELVNKKIEEIIKKKNKTINNEIKINLKNNFKIQESWNRLINLKYSNKLSINVNEIDQIIISKNLKEKDRNKIINIEKNKKLNIYSKTFFNEIKIKYLVKLF